MSVWFLICAAFVAAAVIQGWFSHSRRSQRRIYWGCTIAAAVAIFPIRLPDVEESLGAAAFVLAGMTFVAYMRTPYIRIGGKIYAFPLQDIEPDPEDVGEPHADRGDEPEPNAYGHNISAAKMWWALVGVMVIASGNTIAFIAGSGEWWVAAGAAASLIFFAVLAGYGDGSWDYPVARGQSLQFGVISLITAGLFTVLYLAAFQMARRWPLRRKQSVEYRTHRRHWEEDERPNDRPQPS